MVGAFLCLTEKLKESQNLTEELMLENILVKP